MAKECYVNSKKVGSIHFGVGKSNCLTYIPEDIKLELNEEISNWTQPALTSNGTMDGNAFAVNQSSILNEDSYGFKAFDKQGAGTYWHSAKGFPQSIAWYNPKPLKITNVKITNRSIDGSFPNAYQLQYSDDKNTWTTTNTGNGTSGFSASWNIAVSHTGFHKYWRLVVSSATGANSDYVAIGEIDITAQEQSKTLTLKAGSKVYVPNGVDKFDELVIAKDLTYSVGYNDTRPLMVNEGGTGINGYTVAQTFSGATAPSGSTYMFWYDTTNNVIKETHDSGATWNSTKYSLPICVVKGGSGFVESINQIFNGFGYIGSHWFALPRIKALLIDEINPNGTYKSVEFEVPRVLTHSLSSSFTRTLFINNKNGASLDAGLYYYEQTYAPNIKSNDWERWYNPNENKMYYHQSGGTSWVETEENWVAVGTGISSNGKITSLTPRAVQTKNTVKKINFIYKGSTMIYSDIPTTTFNASSSLQTYVVPNGVTKLHVDCVASQGGNSGGLGGRVQCDLNVTSGDTLYIMVGAVPSSTYTASYNASDIRIGGTEYSNRVVVAGGGGSKSSRGQAGGAGGGLTGANGSNGYGGNSMGKGGTQTAGGAGGSGTPVKVGHYHNGGAGTFGLGGNGSHDSSYEGDAGAGGAGWYGGGAGAGDHNKNGDYVAGGGGGSSYTNSSLCSNVTHTQGYRSGVGYITISLA